MGYVSIVGRNKDLINFRVATIFYPKEIELILDEASLGVWKVR